jgi:hypothetical protein
MSQLLRIERALHDNIVVVEDENFWRLLHVKPYGMLSHTMKIVRALNVEAVAFKPEVAEPHDPHTLTMILLGIRNELGKGHALRCRGWMW